MRPLRWIPLFLLAASLGALPALAAEPSSLVRLGARLQQHDVVRAEFIQTRQMAALKRPLVTTGHLVFSRRYGVLWEIDQPYKAAYVLGSDSMVEIGPDGSRRQRTARDVPGLSQVGRLFRALLGADMAALTSYFEVAVGGDGTKWELRLTPRQPQLAQFLHGLELRGGQFVDMIQIEEAGGDLTRIQFRRSQGGAVLTLAEQQVFGGE